MPLNKETKPWLFNFTVATSLGEGKFKLDLGKDGLQLAIPAQDTIVPTWLNQVMGWIFYFYFYFFYSLW